VTPIRTETHRNLAQVLSQPAPFGKREILNEELFNRMIATERKRTERSKHPFLLMLLEDRRVPGLQTDGMSLNKIISSLQLSIRETDIIGWYRDRNTIGIIYTGIEINDRGAALSMIHSRVRAVLAEYMPSEGQSHINISFHFFPDEWDGDGTGRPSNPALYPDLLDSSNNKRAVLLIKRGIDIVGSLLLLSFCAPMFVIIALAIKASSKGPVLFRQQRVGQYGKQFTFLKFRSMQSANDHSAHRKYMTDFIASRARKQPSSGTGDGVYKLTSDPRVTPVGRFLRRTSLDELPQFMNVLKGEMSLVGPRPPIPYELAAYEIWHRRRLLEVKPGITGLWQVAGRSRVSFNEMVRLDLRYATSWSPSLDLSILMRTPAAVIKGEGAL
jgi:lipopolysaccharide/colanic/teichoic acid biosynthesis glycosyltransferase